MHCVASGGGTYGCSQTSGTTNRREVQPLSRSVVLPSTIHDPISTSLTHGLILPLINLMYGPPYLDHLLGNLFHGRAGTNTLISNLPDLIKSSAKIDRSRPGEEEMEARYGYST